MIDAGWTCRLIRCRDDGGVARLRSRLPGLPTDHWQRPLPWPDVPLVIISVPDQSIPTVAAALARASSLGGVAVLHTSGLEGSGILAPCRSAGASVGSWHPLQSFPASAQETRWEGVACAIEGDAAALATGRALALQLGMRPWRIAEHDKPLYHAAASVAANLPHVMIAVARLLIDSGSGPDKLPPDALEILVRTSVDAALASHGLEGLTGPLARGDMETVRRHLEALPTEVGAVYRAVAALVSSRLADDVFD